MWKDLKEDGEAVSEKRVKRLMREEQIQGKVPKRFTHTTNSDHDHPIAANVLDRDFTAAGPNQRWVDDTTEFVIGENAKLYLAAILDLYSRFVVGWAISAVNDRRLTLKALEMRSSGAALSLCCCITRIAGARTRARTINGISRCAASRAA